MKKTSMRKYLALFTVALVLATTGTALAYGGRMHHGYGGGNQPYMQRGGEYGPWCQPQFGHRGGGPRYGQPGFGNAPAPYMNWNVEIPQVIRDKQVEADKLRIDLGAELNKPQVDKAKALEIWKKHRALRGEISEWFFTQRLEQMTNRPAQ